MKYAADKTSITVSWESPTHDGSTAIVGYYIYWDAALGTIDESSSIASTNWQTLQFTRAGLNTDTYYKFAVSAYNVVGESDKAYSIGIITATVPGQP